MFDCKTENCPNTFGIAQATIFEGLCPSCWNGSTAQPLADFELTEYTSRNDGVIEYDDLIDRQDQAIFDSLKGAQ